MPLTHWSVPSLHSTPVHLTTCMHAFITTAPLDFATVGPAAPSSIEGLETAGMSLDRLAQGSSSRNGGPEGAGAAGNDTGSSNGTDEGSNGDACAALRIDPHSARIEDLPLWRVEYAVFPYSQVGGVG